MDILRKASLVLGCMAYAVCCLFLNLLGGFALCAYDKPKYDISMAQAAEYVRLAFSAGDNFKTAGLCLLISCGALLIALVTAFFRNNICCAVSVITNIAGTLLYIYPIAVLNGVNNPAISAESISKLTSRIYPAVTVTLLLLTAVFAELFSEDRVIKREERRRAAIAEKKRALRDDEKII